MELCLGKRSEKSPVVKVVWESSMEMLREYVDITGTDLSQLRQSWESSTAEECWLNDNVRVYV